MALVEKIKTKKEFLAWSPEEGNIPEEIYFLIEKKILGLDPDFDSAYIHVELNGEHKTYNRHSWIIFTTICKDKSGKPQKVVFEVLTNEEFQNQYFILSH